MRADEAHRVAKAEPVDALADRGLMAVDRLIGFATDDHQPRAGAVRTQPRDGVQQGLEAFDRRDPAHVEEERRLARRDARARDVATAGPEQPGVDAARDDGGVRGVGAVVVDQRAPLDRARRHEPVDVADDPLLLVETHGRLEVGQTACRAILEAAERVEHLEHRHAPALTERDARDSREPVVSVNQVVLDPSRDPPCLDAIDELVEVIVDALARHRRLRSRRQVHHPRALAQRNDAADRRILRAREDVDREAHAPELTAELAHVHVHAARLLAAEDGERTRVHAQHGDAQAHALPFAGSTRTPKTSSAVGPNSYL